MHDMSTFVPFMAREDYLQAWRLPHGLFTMLSKEQRRLWRSVVPPEQEQQEAIWGMATHPVYSMMSGVRMDGRSYSIRHPRDKPDDWVFKAKTSGRYWLVVNSDQPYGARWTS